MVRTDGVTAAETTATPKTRAGGKHGSTIPKPALPDNLIALDHGAVYRSCPTCQQSDMLVSRWLPCSPHGHRWRQLCGRCGDLGWAQDILKRETAQEAS